MHPPALWYHDRHVRGARLDAPLCGVLIRLATAAVVAGEDREAYRSLLMHLNANDLWLACGCRGDDEAHQPILFPRQRKGAALHLVRKGKLAHAHECPFDVLASRTDLLKEEEDEHEEPIPHWEGDWLAAPVQHVSLRRKAAGPSRGGHPPPTLAQKLWTLLDEAGYTTLDVAEIKEGHVGIPTVTSPKAHYAQMHRIDDKAMADGVVFKDIGCTFFPELPKRLMRATTQSSTRVQGYFWGIVDSIEQAGGALAVLARSRDKGEPPLFVPVRTAVTGVPGDGQQGPYWVLAELHVKEHNPAHLEVTRAHVVPALARACLLPVASPAERELAAHVIEQAVFWKAQGVRVPISVRTPALAADAPAFEILIGSRGTIALARTHESVSAIATSDRYAAVFAPPGEDLPAWRRATTAAMWKVIKNRKGETA